MTALIVRKIEFADILPQGRKSLIVRIVDETGRISLKFFHYSANQYHAFVPGLMVSCYGEERYGYAGLEMTHPDYHIIADAGSFIPETRLTPVYPLTEGLSQTVIRKAVKQALVLCAYDGHRLADWLPEQPLKALHYPGLNEAIQIVHTPGDPATSISLQNGSHPALKRLAFEELLTHYLSLRLAKNKNQAYQAPKLTGDRVAAEHFALLVQEGDEPGDFRFSGHEVPFPSSFLHSEALRWKSPLASAHSGALFWKPPLACHHPVVLT